MSATTRRIPELYKMSLFLLKCHYCTDCTPTYTHTYTHNIRTHTFVVVPVVQAGEGQFGTDESTINMVLCSRSFPQLRATFDAYKEIADKDLEDAIEAETSGSLQDGFIAIGGSTLSDALFHVCTLQASFVTNHCFYIYFLLE